MRKPNCIQKKSFGQVGTLMMAHNCFFLNEVMKNRQRRNSDGRCGGGLYKKARRAKSLRPKATETD